MMPAGEAILITAKFLFWELGVTVICLSLLLRIRPLPARLALVLSSNITVNALAATAFSFLGVNSPGLYLGLAVVLLVSGVLFGWGRWRKSLSGAARAARYPISWFAVGFALLVLLVLSIGPLEEIDSLYNLHYVMGWLENKTTPYEFAYNYVPFWELTYVPGFVLTSSDLFVWFSSLKPVVLLGLVLLLTGRVLNLPRRLSIWLLGCLLAFPHLWMGPSGVSTIKNDMLYAAGQAMAALIAIRAVRGRCKPADALMLAFSLVFLCVKFSGPVLLLAGAVVVLPLAWRWVRANIKTAAIVFTGCSALWLISVGHYYAHNVTKFGNPFYPFQINFLFVHLPGRADLSYSSILYNLHDPRLWRAFFLPADGLSPVGLLFPLTLVAILAGSLFFCVKAWLRFRKGRPWLTVALAISLFQLVVWGVYFRSVYSASGWPGDLAFVLNDLNSVRYVEGALLVAELSLVALLLRRGAPAAVVYVLILLQGTSRFWLLLRRDPERHLLLVIILALALAVMWLRIRPKWKLLWSLVLVAGALAVGMHLVEHRRSHWLQQYQAIYLPLYNQPAQQIYLVVDDEFSQQQCAHFPLMGRQLQHKVETGPYTGLLLTAQDPERQPRYVAWMRQRKGEVARSLLPDYETKVDVPAGVLYERVGGR